MTRPNLFSLATSELSQDAFICWLLSWANPSYVSSETALNRTAIFLLNRLLDLGGVRKPEAYNQVVASRQWHHIDVLVEINGECAIVIEDKTFTEQHSGQLERYLAEVTKNKKLPRENVAAIYFKTGDQSSYDDIIMAGYSCFRRSDFLNVLEEGRRLGVGSDIFRDFHAYLVGIEDAVSSFKTKPIKDWDGDCWTGFFIELQKRINGGKWDYVPNKSGGFMGFRWHFRDNKFLQLEEGKLCFKIEVDDKSLQTSKWDEWHKSLMATIKPSEMNVKRPSRRGRGTWMTVGIFDGDYRQTNENGVLDLERTLGVLKKAEMLLDSAVSPDLQLV